MNWKAFSIAVINLGFLFVIYDRLIGCPETPDPYDQFTSFFRNDLSPDKSYKPFYYMNDHWYHFSVNATDEQDATCEDWVRYYSGRFDVRHAHQFICTTRFEDLRMLYADLRSNRPARIPDSLRRQPMAALLIRLRDTAALRYIIFARDAELGRPGDDWTPKQGIMDSLAIDSLITRAVIASQFVPSHFLRMRYAYQAIKLCFYNGHERDCEVYIETLMTDHAAAGSLYPQVLSYRAGQLFHRGRRYEAAYIFTRAFVLSPLKTRKYTSFLDCVNVNSERDLQGCLAYCRDDSERADMIGMFCLGSYQPIMPTLQKIYRLYPASEMLEVLALRDINMIEERYFSPRLHRQEGGMRLYISDERFDSVHVNKRWRNETVLLAAWCDKLAGDPSVRHQGMYQTAAAYCYYMLQQYAQANALLDRAAGMPADDRLRSQQLLIRLLVALNKAGRLDASAEMRLLPAVRWLEKKAIAEGKGIYHTDYDSYSPGLWQQFYRNLLAEMLAKAYHHQQDSIREILCIGAGERLYNRHIDYPLNRVRERVQDKFTADQLGALWDTLYSAGASGWTGYLVKRFPMSRNDLVMARATAYIREHRWDEALIWLGQVRRRSSLKLDRDPFAQALGDQQDSLFAQDRGRFDKLSFVRRMKLLSQQEREGVASSGDLYQLATGYYNMTYYGRAWETVKADRTGTYWTELPAGKTVFEKDYYGCYTAEIYYKKAMAASRDKEFQARCIFMLSKCVQKRFRGDFLYQATRNKYFPTLVRDYGNTAFYREAFHGCSYLRDFIQKK